MDTALLRAFIEVAKHGGFSSAAETLHLTQPAVSKRIAQLEEQLDARLFDRIGKRTTLTEAGLTLLPRARRILSDLADTERAVRDLDGHVGGQLRIATSHHIGLHRLPPLLRTFCREHPAVNLQISFMDSEQANALVAQGDTELGVITLAPDGPLGQLEAREIWPDPLSIMVAPDHALAGRREVSIIDLADHPAVLPGTGTYTGQILEQLFRDAGTPLRISMSTNYLETLRMLATIGLGWTVLPDSMAGEGLIRLQLKQHRLQRSLGIVLHRERSLSNAAQAFIDLLDREIPVPARA